jgi:hypothetical protein
MKSQAPERKPKDTTDTQDYADKYRSVPVSVTRLETPL